MWAYIKKNSTIPTEYYSYRHCILGVGNYREMIGPSDISGRAGQGLGLFKCLHSVKCHYDDIVQATLGLLLQQLCLLLWNDRQTAWPIGMLWLHHYDSAAFKLISSIGLSQTRRSRATAARVNYRPAAPSGQTERHRRTGGESSPGSFQSICSFKNNHSEKWMIKLWRARYSIAARWAVLITKSGVRCGHYSI